MSNYPPGVTGHEYAIAGPSSERTASREVGPCVYFEGVYVTQVTRGGTEYPEGTFTGKSKQGIVRRAKGRNCTFSGGEVEGEIVDHAWFDWECPSCTHTNTEDIPEE